MNSITTHKLSCGLPVIIETMESVQSAAISWLVPAGSAHDPEDRLGMSAMWSELLVRGAGDLNSRQHADAVDRLGASRSATTGTFTMVLSSICLGSRLVEFLPLLTDTVLKPRMEEDAIEPSRDLCLQAIQSLQDEPTERAMLAARERHHPTPINRSGLGTPEGLNSLTRDELASAWKARVKPASSIFAAAGNIDRTRLLDELERLLSGWSGATPEPKLGPKPARGYAHIEDPSSQLQIVVVHDAPAEPSPDSLLEKIVVSVLSGGMAGRLFTEVREKRGLCYSVSAGYRGDRDYGSVTAYVGTTPERAEESLKVLIEELRRIQSPAGLVTPEEFARAIVGMKSGLIMSGESTSARAGGLAADVRKLGRPRSLEEIAAEIDRITLDDIHRYLGRRSLGRMTIQTLGPRALTPPSDMG